MKFKQIFDNKIIEKYDDKELQDISKKYNDIAEISFKIQGDAKYSLFHFIKILKYNGDVGHSFTYKIEDTEERFGFDGDGADKIFDLKIKDIKYDLKEMKFSTMKKIVSQYDKQKSYKNDVSKEEIERLLKIAEKGCFLNDKPAFIKNVTEDNFFIIKQINGSESIGYSFKSSKKILEKDGRFYTANYR